MQQINLYTREFQPDRSPLRLAHMGIAAGVFLAFLLIYSLWCAHLSSERWAALARTQEQTAALTEKRDQLAAQSGEIQADRLDQRVAETREAIAKRRQLRSLIERQDLGNARGFSDALRALARQSQPRLALEAFSLSRGGRYASLSGSTASPPLVPRYLESLRGESAFRDTALGVIRLDQQESGGLHGFSVAPPGEDDDEGAGP